MARGGGPSGVVARVSARAASRIIKQAQKNGHISQQDLAKVVKGMEGDLRREVAASVKQFSAARSAGLAGLAAYASGGLISSDTFKSGGDGG